MSLEEPPEKIRKIDTMRIKVYPILDSTLTCDTIPSTSFQALRLENKKIIGTIIRRLPELPEELSHLKRVGKDGSVLIAESEEVAKLIVGKLEDAEARVEDLVPVKVARTKPQTRRQFQVAKELWPTGFHPNHELEQLLDGSFLTESLKKYVDRWLGEAARLGDGCIAVQNDELLSTGRPSSHPLGHPVMEMVGNLPKRHGDDYLGTGSDVFLITEPCAMCSMALVHFRVKRVFYARNSRNGVLKEDGWQLHLEPSINHHYEVFRVEGLLDNNYIVDNSDRFCSNIQL
ncbi:CMP/dCMP-type deaminase domain-containing protein [Caenorhabditis elegans]|uniref:CMP/dCMP-type deaminase domain-containing protein n=1 Tax=Caenorhabditis elegans TaxID=6239 RepID=Q9NAH8_CAEEL|nr:CMP/dCMP-type deaminase domain-containing protein [Caenorhabditis elegans]CAB55073.2 CMP/dCMP-type deaminase domain-containing protein [Caenorhabditis elegans]|eukprot:NP_499445.2 Uncharacterized protein CELE_Y47D3A.14 [Caenorhabditis elegans]